jgi:hypothetical protein
MPETEGKRPYSHVHGRFHENEGQLERSTSRTSELSSNETPAVGSHSVEPRLPIRVAPALVRRTRQAGVAGHGSAVTHRPRQHLIDEHICRFNANADNPSTRTIRNSPARSSPDSPLERAGFEPSVPGESGFGFAPGHFLPE